MGMAVKTVRACVNLSNNSQSISRSIQLLKDDIKDLKTEKDQEWFQNLFGHWGIKGWAASILNSLLWAVIIVVIVLVVISCLFKVLTRFWPMHF